MKTRTVFLIGLAAMLCVSAAHAKDCGIQPSNLDAFGHYRLGQHLKAIPKGVTKLPDCTENPKHHYFDCEFTDADGNAYLVGEGDEIARLQRRPEISPASPLPYGLRFGMPLKDAARALSAADPGVTMMAGHNEDGDFLTSGECLKDRHGITYSFDLGFDKTGGLNEVTAAFETAED